MVTKGANKQPYYSMEGAKKIELCSQHAREGMVDVVTKGVRHNEWLHLAFREGRQSSTSNTPSRGWPQHEGIQPAFWAAEVMGVGVGVANWIWMPTLTSQKRPRQAGAVARGQSRGTE